MAKKKKIQNVLYIVRDKYGDYIEDHAHDLEDLQIYDPKDYTIEKYIFEKELRSETTEEEKVIKKKTTRFVDDTST